MAVAVRPDGADGGTKFAAIVRSAFELNVTVPIYPEFILNDARLTLKSHVQFFDVLSKTTSSPY